LVDRDAVRLGGTILTFRQPVLGAVTTSLEHPAVIGDLTPMQRKVLIALCRPYKEGGTYAVPASNTQIAAELVLSIDAVKSHMRGLFERFAVADLAQNQKRARVVELAFSAGVVSERDL
jgi:DNA-binding NarL/FixJ family response regulator